MQKIEPGDWVLVAGLGYATVKKILKNGRYKIDTEADWDPSPDKPYGNHDFTVDKKQFTKLYNRQENEWQKMEERK